MYFNHIYIKVSKYSSKWSWHICSTFNYKEEVWDEYDTITTLNQNDKYGWLWHNGNNQDGK